MQSGAELLKAWIERRGYRQNEAAIHLDLNEAFLSMLVNGKRLPSLDNAIRIERHTGIPVEAWSSSERDSSEPAIAAVAGKRRVHR